MADDHEHDPDSFMEDYLKKEKEYNKKVLFYILIFQALLVFGFLMMVGGYKAQKEEINLVHEFNSIPIFADAKQVYYKSSYKEWYAWVNSSFSTDKDFAEVKEYFDKVLVDLGWNFYKEDKVEVWGKDTGRIKLIYHKEKYEAVLEQTSGTRGYSLDISW